MHVASSKEENVSKIKMEVRSALNLHTKGTNPIPHWVKGGPRTRSDSTPFLYMSTTASAFQRNI
jgi:hypothetical protein